GKRTLAIRAIPLVVVSFALRGGKLGHELIGIDGLAVYRSGHVSTGVYRNDGWLGAFRLCGRLAHPPTMRHGTAMRKPQAGIPND
ncbi:hypothetical protein, partial [Caulobacter sp. UNC279MFTsu5.1]|uniref:hypothetical protein n=1 Tax=Caulobacter sp. UNC279MFTsu5.1 TaxID=1502775 RepID=UPI0015A5C674